MRRRRSALWSVGVVAVVLPLAVAAASAAATRGPAASPGALQALARPRIDATYLYRQLYTMSENYVFRASGLDGPPQHPGSRFNLPPTVNGWQEFYAHW